MHTVFTRATYITVGGLTVALCILAWRVTRWWRVDMREVRAAVPYLLGVLLAMLSVLCTGGALGYFFGFVANIMNEGGDKFLTGATGATGVAIHGGAHAGALTEPGAMILLVFCAVLAALWKSVTREVTIDLVLGAITGTALGLSAGGAGLAADTLVPAVNGLGAMITGLVS